MYIAIIVGLALLVGMASIIITKDNHNPVEKMASDLIEKETGIDFDKMLPPNK